MSPFDVHVVIANKDADAGTGAVQLAAELDSRGFEVVLDDRKSSPGVKFKDAELLGVPWIVVVGRGLGGPVALMASALCGVELKGVASWSGLTRFQDLTETDEYAWPAAAFLPDALARFDLPDLVRGLPVPVSVLDPRDGRREPMTMADAQAALSALPSTVTLLPSCTEAEAVAHLHEVIAGEGDS